MGGDGHHGSGLDPDMVQAATRAASEFGEA